MDKLIIMAAINESVPKASNACVPYSPQEVADEAYACYKAGASIVHFHARDAKTGEQLWNDYGAYAETMRLIRQRCDVLLYPSYTSALPLKERFQHMFRLAEDPAIRLRYVCSDLGAVLSARYDAATGKLDRADKFSANTFADIEYLLRESKARGIKVDFGIREASHLRHVEWFAHAGLAAGPHVLRLSLTETAYYGLPATAEGLQTYLNLMPKGMDTVWFVQASGRANRPMNTLAITMGGHVRTGVGDVQTEDGRPTTNVGLVQRHADIAKAVGRGIATPAEARKMMGIA